MKQMNFTPASWTGRTAAVLLLLALLFLAACGNQTNTPSNEASPSSADGSTSTGNKPANTAQETAGPAEETTKTVKTASGDITIPAHPQRIVADDYLGTLIALGVKPVGTPGLHLENLYFAESLEGVEDIGAYGNSSVEKVVDLQPDLIITSRDDEANYEMLSKAAPTVAVPFGQLKNAREELTYFGELLGLEDKAEAWLKEYDERIAKAKEKVDKAIPAEATFSILEDNDKSVWVYGENFGRGGQPVYQALGRKPPQHAAEEITKLQYKELSMEILPEYAGDYLVITSNTRTADDFKKDPVWGSLDAVKNDRIYVWKEERSWYYDPIAVLAQTEELADWLAGK